MAVLMSAQILLEAISVHASLATDWRVMVSSVMVCIDIMDSNLASIVLL